MNTGLIMLGSNENAANNFLIIVPSSLTYAKSAASKILALQLSIAIINEFKSLV
jgi:hypothetical protein